MACCENISRVGAYHDGELGAAERREFQQHLKTCDACRQELQRLAALSSWLTSQPAPAAPPDVLQRLRQSYKPQQERVLVRTAGALTGIAAAVLIACSAILWQRATAGTSSAAAAWEKTAVTAAAADSSSAQLDANSSGEVDEDVQLIQSILGDDTEGGYGNE